MLNKLGEARLSKFGDYIVGIHKSSEQVSRLIDSLVICYPNQKAIQVSRLTMFRDDQIFWTANLSLP